MGSLDRRLERLEASVFSVAKPELDIPPEVQDYLDELAIHRGEISEVSEAIPGLAESRRRANEAAAVLVDEWRRLGIAENG